MRRRAHLVTVALVIWAIAVVVLATQLAVPHSAALPPPRDRARLAAAVRGLGPIPARAAIHVIPAGCSCTLRLLSQLVRRRARSGWTEVVILAGGGEASGLAAAGYQVRPVDGGWPADAGIDGAPLLAVIEDGAVTWVGGYFDVPAANRPLDARVLEAVERGQPPAGLPVFGCAMTPQQRRRRDPAGLVGG